MNTRFYKAADNDPQNWDGDAYERELFDLTTSYRDTLVQLAKRGDQYVFQTISGELRQHPPERLVFENLPVEEFDEAIKFWLQGDMQKAFESFCNQCEAGLQKFAENEAEERLSR